MKKRVKWAYEAEFDYILPLSEGKWVIGFLDEEGNPYECPTTTDSKLIDRLEKLTAFDSSRRLRVTVEINEKLDRHGKQYPKLVGVSRAG